MQSGTSECPCKNHTDFHNPPFPKNAVPDKFFFKNPDDPNSRKCKYCYFCRVVKRTTSRRNLDKRKEEAKKQNDLVRQGIGELMYCTDDVHEGSSGSKYPRDKVPIEQFRRRFGDRRSQLVKTCIDCRRWRNSVSQANTNKHKEEAKSEGRILCGSCLKDVTDCPEFNRDGTIHSNCKECREAKRRRAREAKAHYKQIIKNRIKEHEVCCMRCEKLYFSPMHEDSFAVQEFDTYVRDGFRYCTIKGIEYRASEVLTAHDEFIELDIIELDHLTMQEQLERGIIKHESEYSPKWKGVSEIKNEQDMDFEAVGCQHLCARCHVIVTIEREVGKPHRLSQLGKDKLNYVNLLKSFGCTSCEYMNPRLPRFFELDHIENKIEAISVMVRDDNITYEQFVEECKKCRVLCRFFHKIRTRLQRKEGIVSLKK